MTELAKTCVIVAVAVMTGVSGWFLGRAYERQALCDLYEGLPNVTLAEDVADGGIVITDVTVVDPIAEFERRVEGLEAILKPIDPNKVYDFSYDPNDPAYKFIPAAPQDWIDRFGDNERTRLLHTISEIRVVVANIGNRLHEEEIADQLGVDGSVELTSDPVVDPNEVAE